MAVVYLAEHDFLQRKVALKVLAAQLAEDERFRERFMRESRLAASLDHPNVVPIYEAGASGGDLFIAMRYVEGTDLDWSPDGRWIVASSAPNARKHPLPDPRRRERRVPDRHGHEPFVATGGGMSDLEATVPEGVSASPEISVDELQLSLRNHGMQLEGLRYDVTPAGMHYLLIHFDVPEGHADTWSLSIDGLVSNPTRLTLPDLRARPTVTMPITMECAGNGRARLTPRPISQPWLTEAIGTAEWTGTPLRPIFEEAGIKDEAIELVFTGADRGIQGEIEQDYQRSLTIADAMRDEVLLAYEMNGAPLPPQHGFPLRLVVPGWYGMTSVKWLNRISAVAEPFEGYQQTAYRFRQQPEDEGEPVTRMRPRSLMIPPGIPDFMTRRRFVEAGTVELMGRAWSGAGPIVRVEVSTDGGSSWGDATLVEPPSLYAWTPWRFAWDAEPGTYELSPRATDAEGNTQPLEQPWNLHGFANNMVQRVPVEVRG